MSSQLSACDVMSNTGGAPWDSEDYPLRMCLDLKTEDFFSVKETRNNAVPKGNPKRGKMITVNGRKLAIFLHQGKAYAIEETCPHLGGPLHLGDIEDMGNGTAPRVRCPWHKWCFDLTTGQQVRPHPEGESTTTFPACVRPDKKIEVGFKSLDKSYFQSAADF